MGVSLLSLPLAVVTDACFAVKLINLFLSEFSWNLICSSVSDSRDDLSLVHIVVGTGQNLALEPLVESETNPSIENE